MRVAEEEEGVVGVAEGFGVAEEELGAPRVFGGKDTPYVPEGAVRAKWVSWVSVRGKRVSPVSLRERGMPRAFVREERLP